MAIDRDKTSRAVAAHVLYRVATDSAFASVALDAELERAALSSRDAALATEITYGTLRALADIDALLETLLARPLSDLEPHVHAILRTGAYQILHLERVPVHAAVDESVRLAHKIRGKNLAGLVNAVLRKVVASRPETPAPPRKLAMPAWLSSLLVESLGSERAAAFSTHRTMPVPLGVRVQTKKVSVDAFKAKLVAFAPEASVQEGVLSKRALLVRFASDPRRWPGYTEGEFAIQDEGSLLIAELVGAMPGERILDACAGRGGKTLVLAEAVGESGHITATDMYPGKLEKMLPECERLGIASEPIELVGLDFSVGTGGLPATFDRVLIDAPCTGLGTIHRRPEILLRVGPEDAARMQVTQLQILSRAAMLVRPGGVVVYSVCSPARAEGADVAQKFLAEVPGFELRPSVLTRPGLEPDEDGILRLGPFQHPEFGPDAYQLAAFQRLP